MKKNDKLYLWLDHLENSSADLDAWKTTLCYISVMVKQLENGYKDTALEIAGKCIIKSGYCMLLKSNYIFQFFFNAIPRQPMNVETEFAKASQGPASEFIVRATLS